MSENYLWSTYGVSDAGDDWNMAATPSYQGQTTAAFNADTFRILKSTKHPDEAFTAAALSARAPRTCSSCYAGMPAVEAEQDAFLAGLQADYKPEVDWNVAKRRRRPSPTSRTSSRTCPTYDQTLDLLNHVHHASGSRPPASTSTPRSRPWKIADAGHLGQGRR